MKIKTTILMLSLLLVLVVPALAEQNVVDSNIPDSWFEAPKLASELGIDSFQQSSIFDERVKNGELPPVGQRLPEDPPVVEPYEQVGKYGGTAHIWFPQELNFNTGGWQAFTAPYSTRAARAVPDGTKLVPSLIKGWDYSKDYKTLTLYLRKGLKWSDGHPFTTEDYMYWWDHIANNKDLSPVPPENWSPPLMNVEAKDKYTVSFHYGESAPTQHFSLHQGGPGGGTFDNPKHYMKRFHIDFRDKDELMQEAEEAGFDTWFGYYEYMQSTSHPDRGIRPSLNTYIVTERTTTYIETERNPYFPFVDTEGNQLPYIDKVRRHKASDVEMGNMKAVTGEATIAGNNLKVTDIPLYKKNEEKGGYTTYFYTAGYGSWLGIHVNLTHEDDKLRNIFQDLRFRKALSYSINRSEINEKVFFGQAVPRQSTVLPSNDYFKPEYAEAYIEFAPEKAEKLLDEIGMVDVNGDGYRELPDGEIFNPQLIYMEGEGPKTPMLELVISHWQEVGLNVDLKLLERDLYIERKSANKFDISMWHIDAVTDIMFPNNLAKTFAPIEGSWNALTPWPAWVDWFSTKGETGMEPPQKIKDIVAQGRILRTSPDKTKRQEAAKKIIAAQAENLWSIGTVGLGPAPVIVDNDLKNVPKKGLWVYDVSFMAALYDCQFYFDN